MFVFTFIVIDDRAIAEAFATAEALDFAAYSVNWCFFSISV